MDSSLFPKKKFKEFELNNMRTASDFLKIAKHSMQTAGIKLGSVCLPEFRAKGEEMLKAADMVEDWIKQLEEIIEKHDA